MKQLTLGLLCLGLVAPSVFADPIAPSLKGDLVAVNGKDVGSFDDSALNNAKYFAVYFSAEWCGPCRAFTPELVKWYNRKKPKHPEFELIFVSSDRDEASMQKYMTGDKMPWPAVTFAKARTNPLRKYAGPGIPCLVFIDADGKVLSHSFEGSNYVGPDKVLKDIDRALGGGSSTGATTSSLPPSSLGSGSSLGTGTGLGVGSGGKPASPQGSTFDDFFKKK